MSVVSYRACYARSVRIAAGGALVVHFLIVMLSPPFEFQAYTMPPEPPPPLIEVQFAVTVSSDPPPEPKPPEPRIDPAPGYESDPDLESPEPPFLDRVPSGPGVNPVPQRPDPRFPPGVTQLPEPIHIFKAEYPDLAREAGIEGRVLVAILVDENGKPLQAKVVSSEVTAAMERVALEAAMKSRFEPARQRLQAVRAWVAIPFDFRLR